MASPKQIKDAFQSLMGMNGDIFRDEIIETGLLSQSSYDAIVGNVIYNGESSILEHFGIVQWYYFRWKFVQSITDKF